MQIHSNMHSKLNQIYHIWNIIHSKHSVQQSLLAFVHVLSATKPQTRQPLTVWYSAGAIATAVTPPYPQCTEVLLFWQAVNQAKLRVNKRLNFSPHLYTLVVAGSTAGWPDTGPGRGPPSRSPCCRRSSPHHSGWSHCLWYGHRWGFRDARNWWLETIRGKVLLRHIRIR